MLKEICREAIATLALLKCQFRLVGQVLEWPYGYFDDRSGSEKLMQ
jgi:hypothetical protein